MTRQSMVRTIALFGAIAAVAAVACGDPYLATNPYDPDVAVQFTITGPDSLFSLGEAAQYTVHTVPSFSDTSFVWSTDTFYNSLTFLNVPSAIPVSDGTLFLQPSGAGGYRSVSPPLEPVVFNIAISVAVGAIDTMVGQCGATTGCIFVPTTISRHYGYKNVVVTQRVTHIQLRCPDTHSCAPLSVGDSAFVWVDGTDALGRQIVALTSPTANPPVGNPQVLRGAGNPVVTYVSRDSTVARATAVGVRVCKATALRAGTTWIVATRGSLLDSLQIIVH